MEQEIRNILVHHKEGILSTKKAIRLIEVLHGNRKSVTCFLDRLPKECSIAKLTKNGCENCGHNQINL